MMRDVGYSVNAFYAADSGIEQALDDFYIDSDPPIRNNIAGASFEIGITCNNDLNPSCPPGWEDNENCNSENFCIKSKGNYQGTRRAIETQY